MFKTAIGVTEDSAPRGAICAPRPRRASSSTSPTSSARPAASCPSASARPARAFRNEITPGNFIFRTREFEQMELRVLLQARHRIWSGSPTGRPSAENWLLSLGHPCGESPLRDHEQGGAVPLFQRHHRHRVSLPVRLGRAVGHRGPHQLRPAPSIRRPPASRWTYFDQETNEHYIPYCDRAVAGRATAWLLTALCDAYDEEVVDAKGRRTPASCCTCIRRWRRSSAPCCRCPRSWAPRPMEIYVELSKQFMVRL
jgi:glycyl-tRNA synthetase